MLHCFSSLSVFQFTSCYFLCFFFSLSGLPCSCPDHFVPVCARNGRTYPSACVARCMGFQDNQFVFGSCRSTGPCSPNPCQRNQRWEQDCLRALMAHFPVCNYIRYRIIKKSDAACRLGDPWFKPELGFNRLSVQSFTRSPCFSVDFLPWTWFPPNFQKHAGWFKCVYDALQ